MQCILPGGTKKIWNHYKTMFRFTGTNLTKPATVHFATSERTLLLCDLMKRRPFGITISENLIGEKRQRGSYYHEYLYKRNWKQRWKISVYTVNDTENISNILYFTNCKLWCILPGGRQAVHNSFKTMLIYIGRNLTMQEIVHYLTKGSFLQLRVLMWNFWNVQKCKGNIQHCTNKRLWMDFKFLEAEWMPPTCWLVRSHDCWEVDDT